jgi:hypothetical protein
MATSGNGTVMKCLAPLDEMAASGRTDARATTDRK